MSPNSLSAAANVLASNHGGHEDSGCYKCWHKESFVYCTAVASAFEAAFLVLKHTCGMFLTYTAFLLESSSL